MRDSFSGLWWVRTTWHNMKHNHLILADQKKKTMLIIWCNLEAGSSFRGCGSIRAYIHILTRFSVFRLISQTSDLRGRRLISRTEGFYCWANWTNLEKIPTLSNICNVRKVPALLDNVKILSFYKVWDYSYNLHQWFFFVDDT